MNPPEDEKEFAALLATYAQAYYNSTPLVSDEEFDALQALYEQQYGSYHPIGAPVGTKEKVILPIYLGSLNKVRTQPELDRWSKQHPGLYIVMAKVDGISTLISAEGKLYTRGDGVEGTDISHLIPYLRIPIPATGYVRSEVVMPCSIFQRKYATTMANPRNMTAGIINSKEFDPIAARELLTLSYELIPGADLSTPMETQLETLVDQGYEIPHAELFDTLQVEELTTYLQDLKERLDYEIDGLVIFPNHPYTYSTGQNPRYAVAFKIEAPSAVTTVTEVEWNISKNGFYKPRVQFAPVELSGVTITYATGFNAKFILDHRIGPGTTLVITRSGEVIPYIKEVLTGTEAQLPTTCWRWVQRPRFAPVGSVKPPEVDYKIVELEGQEYYAWVEISDVDIEACAETMEQALKRNEAFFTTLNAKHVGAATLTKLYQAGYRTIGQLLTLTLPQITTVEGFKEKSGLRVIEAIQGAIVQVPIARVLAASGVFGEGVAEKKLQLIFEAYPSLLQECLSLAAATDRIRGLRGFADSAVRIAERLPAARQFLEEHPQIIPLYPAPPPVGGALSGQSIVFTGYRDKPLEAQIIAAGGKVTTALSGKTTLLLVAAHGTGNQKEQSALARGIRVLTGDEFRAEFF